MSSNYNHAISEASKRYLGVEEWPGAKSNPVVEEFFARAGFNGMTDDVPWCAAFVGAVLAECGIAPSNSLMARSYERWGASVQPAMARLGDVVVLERGAKPAGHVGFFVSYDGDRVILRGGNQGDKVSDASFPASRIVAIRRADPSQASGRAIVQIGDKGPFVLDLQSQLRDLRYFAGRRDGDFGPLTDAAVKAFQSDNGLEVDGVVGNRTWAALAKAQPRPERTVTMKDLRKSGSETIKAADKAEAGVAVGSVATGLALVTQVSDHAKQATAAIGEAQGALDGLQSALLTYWPLIAVAAVLGGVWWSLREIKARRLRDAQTGANVAR
jgi:uncharacterized protein (TIGR02594 family)